MPRATAIMSLLAAALILVLGLEHYRAYDQSAVRLDQITYFYQSDCDKCENVRPLVDECVRRHAEVDVTRLDMKWLTTIDLRRVYDRVYGVSESKRLEVPALFVGTSAYVGEDAIRQFMEHGAKGVKDSSRWQEAADRYAPGMLRLILVGALLATAFSTWAEPPVRARTTAGIRLLLGAVLLVAVIFKMSQLSDVAETLSQQWGLPIASAAALILVAITAESVVATVLVSGYPRFLALRAPLILFGGFLLYTIAALFFQVSGDCGCFPWKESLGWPTLARNLGFAVLALTLAQQTPPSDARPHQMPVCR